MTYKNWAEVGLHCEAVKTDSLHQNSLQYEMSNAVTESALSLTLPDCLGELKFVLASLLLVLVSNES